MVIPRKDFNWENIVMVQMPKFSVFFVSTELAILRCSSALKAACSVKTREEQVQQFGRYPLDTAALSQRPCCHHSHRQIINCSMALHGLLVLFPEAARTPTRVRCWAETLMLKLSGDGVSLLWPLR